MAEEEETNARTKKSLEDAERNVDRIMLSIRALEREISSEEEAQRGFNLAERTQRIQENYTNMRGSMTSYFNHISGALPLLMILSGRADNMRLRELMPVLLGTVAQFQNGENVRFWPKARSSLRWLRRDRTSTENLMTSSSRNCRIRNGTSP